MCLLGENDEMTSFQFNLFCLSEIFANKRKPTRPLRLLLHPQELLPHAAVSVTACIDGVKEVNRESLHYHKPMASGQRPTKEQHRQAAQPNWVLEVQPLTQDCCHARFPVCRSCPTTLDALLQRIYRWLLWVAEMQVGRVSSTLCVAVVICCALVV